MSRKLSTMIDSIQVLGYTIAVEFIENELIVDGEPCFGCYDPANQKIEILHGDNVSHEKQLATLVHEATECMNDVLETDLEHNMITTIESFVFTLMRNNPALAKAFSLYPKGNK